MPLLARLHTKQLHELLNFYFRVFAAKTFSSSEETVFTLLNFHCILWWPFLYFNKTFFFFAILFATFFLALLLFFISIATLLPVEFFLILLWLGVATLNQTLHGLVWSISRYIFHLLNSGERVNLRMWFGCNRS